MVKINGEDIAASGKSISEYLTEAGYEALRVVVEKNGDIVPRNKWEDTVLISGDVIEIVSFVGGG